MSLTIVNRTKHTPAIPWAAIAEAVVGRRYDLTLHIVGKTRAKTVNQLTRQKTYAPNVLSFPYTNIVGEIIICPDVAAKEARDWDMTVDGYLGFLFIHGLLHLKGYDHGPAMETLEKKYIRSFKLV